MKKKYYLWIIAVIVVILILFTTNYLINSNKNKDILKVVDLLTIPDIEKVFINGMAIPRYSKIIMLDNTKGNVNKILVENGQMINKGDELFIYKNDDITKQIVDINKQIITSNQKYELNNILKELKELEYYTVYAPVDGEIILNENEVDVTTPFIIIESTELYIKGYISEREFTKLNISQSANLYVISTNEKLKGKVESIGKRPMNLGLGGLPLIDEDYSNISYYEVAISLDSQKGVINGFHVQATVDLEESIEIPKSSILSENNKNFVLKYEDSNLVKQEISYNDNNLSYVGVLSGLEENDKIAIDVDGLEEGMPVE